MGNSLLIGSSMRATVSNVVETTLGSDFYTAVGSITGNRALHDYLPSRHPAIERLGTRLMGKKIMDVRYREGWVETSADGVDTNTDQIISFICEDGYREDFKLVHTEEFCWITDGVTRFMSSLWPRQTVKHQPRDHSVFTDIFGRSATEVPVYNARGWAIVDRGYFFNGFKCFLCIMVDRGRVFDFKVSVN